MLVIAQLTFGTELGVSPGGGTKGMTIKLLVPCPATASV